MKTLKTGGIDMKNYLLESGFGYAMDDISLVRSVKVSQDKYLHFHIEFNTETNCTTIAKFCGYYDLITTATVTNTPEEFAEFVSRTIKDMKPYLTYAEYLQAHEEELEYDLTFTNDRLWLTSIGF